MFEQLQVNKKIDLNVKGGPFEGSYTSKVAEIEKDKFKVYAPLFKGGIVPLNIDQELEVFFTGNAAAYKFFAKIIDRQKEPIAMLTLKEISNCERIQRREHFRIEARKKVKFRILDDIKKGSDKELKKAVTIDISGGGIKIITEESIKSNTLMELYIDIPEIEDIPIHGRAVSDCESIGNYVVGVEFINLSKQYQEKIISWVFNHQRKLRQKGLL